MLLLLAACLKPLPPTTPAAETEAPAPVKATEAAEMPSEINYSRIPRSEQGCQPYQKPDNDSEGAAPWADGEGPGQKVDLDGDGVAEFIAEVSGSCGSGGCDVEILQRCSAPSTFRSIYTFGGWTVVGPSLDRTNGVLDVNGSGALATEQVGSEEPFLFSQQISTHVWNGEGYQPAKTERVFGSEGLLAQVLTLPNTPDNEGCSRSRIQVPTEEGWRTVATVPGMVTVSVSEQGQWAGIVSCAEHTEGLMLGETWMPISTPELPWSLSWMPPGEQDQARVALLGQDLSQPVQLVVFEQGAAGWAPGPSLCEPASLESGTVTWQGEPLQLLEERDLNEDGTAELIAKGAGGVHVLGACNSAGSSYRSLGLLSSAKSTSVDTGVITAKHFELVSTNAKGAEQRWAWSGWRYEAVN